MIMRSSSVRPCGSCHMAMSADMPISCGIQWLLHADRYLSQAHLYLNGTSWLRSAWQLMIFLSSTRMRDAPISRSSRPVAPAATAAACAARSLACDGVGAVCVAVRSEEHTSELQSLMRI